MKRKKKPHEENYSLIRHLQSRVYKLESKVMYEPVEEVTLKQLSIDELREQFETQNRCYDLTKHSSFDIDYECEDTQFVYIGFLQCAKANNLIKE